ncbi:MAG: hydantoinase B/oxoprolinase family protein [Anaerolineaceae bacterium]|nr:hydantoinase B/oxoprolinase family protein [Anaerolineaceae bacterium]
MTVDRFTLEIIAESLRAGAREMFITYGRTAQSPIIYEVLDMACGLTSVDSELIAEAEGVPGFIGCLSFAVREITDKFEPSSMQPGDIYATNDPYKGGGTHLSDVCLVSPIFHEGQLVAFAANKAHWTEVGGMAPGSWTTDSTEVYQEGIQLPAIQLFDAGEAIPGILDILEANVRLPRMTLGDMYAGIAALRAGERCVRQICAKYGHAALRETIATLLERGEQVARAALAQLPAGTYHSEMWIDDDGLSDEPLFVCVKVLVSADRFLADFTGCAPQAVGPINSTHVGTLVSVREIFKEVLDPDFPNNDGFFRPIEVICPPGTLFSAERPAPTSTYWETGAYVHDLIWQALFPVAQGRLPVGHHLSICGTIVSGEDEERGPFVLVEPQAGGWGAAPGRDGQSGLVPAGDGETYIMPVEVCETRYPIVVDQFAFNTEPGGAGRWRGGYGLIRDYRVTAESADLTATFGRFKFPPWGADGGADGSANAIEIFRAGQAEPELRTGKVARLRLATDDIARLITAVGGGYGPAPEREPQAVALDVHNETLSPADAREIYGVTLSADGTVDAEQTNALRQQLQGGDRS